MFVAWARFVDSLTKASRSNAALLRISGFEFPCFLCVVGLSRQFQGARRHGYRHRHLLTGELPLDVRSSRRYPDLLRIGYLRCCKLPVLNPRAQIVDFHPRTCKGVPHYGVSLSLLRGRGGGRVKITYSWSNSLLVDIDTSRDFNQTPTG